MRYLSQSLMFDDTSIYFINELGEKEYVMMDWEREVMRRHAEIVCENNGHVLEIGFGMGISAGYIQDNEPLSHTIVENHPQVITKALDWAEGKSNVTIVQGSWIDKLDELSMYDGIFYDAYGDENFLEFKNQLTSLMKPNGIFTWWNAFDIKKNVYEFLENVTYEKIIVAPSDNFYYTSDIYYLPKKQF